MHISSGSISSQHPKCNIIEVETKKQNLKNESRGVNSNRHTCNIIEVEAEDEKIEQHGLGINTTKNKLAQLQLKNEEYHNDLQRLSGVLNELREQVTEFQRSQNKNVELQNTDTDKRAPETNSNLPSIIKKGPPINPSVSLKSDIKVKTSTKENLSTDRPFWRKGMIIENSFDDSPSSEVLQKKIDELFSKNQKCEEELKNLLLQVDMLKSKVDIIKGLENNKLELQKEKQQLEKEIQESKAPQNQTSVESEDEVKSVGSTLTTDSDTSQIPTYLLEPIEFYFTLNNEINEETNRLETMCETREEQIEEAYKNDDITHEQHDMLLESLEENHNKLIHVLQLLSEFRTEIFNDDDSYFYLKLDEILCKCESYVRNEFLGERNEPQRLSLLKLLLSYRKDYNIGDGGDTGLYPNKFGGYLGPKFPTDDRQTIVINVYNDGSDFDSIFYESDSSDLSDSSDS